MKLLILFDYLVVLVSIICQVANLMLRFGNQMLGHFSVKYFYKVLSALGLRMEGWHNFWVSYVPPRVLAFCWVAEQHKILTIDNL